MESICHHVFGYILRNDLIGLETVLNKFPDALEYNDRFSNTPLLYACYCGRSEIVGYLLASGANHQRINVFGKYLTVHMSYPIESIP